MTEVAFKDELETVLESTSMENKTLIISVLNNAYVKENGMLDLFLQSLKQGENTEFLIKHLLLIAVDQIAFDRCKVLNLNCYRLVTENVDFSQEQLYMTDGFIKMMWRKTLFLGDVLKRGYSFIFTDIDVMWLRNPFTKLSHKGEDLQISCDGYNGEPFSKFNAVNTGFFFVASNNKTTALFDVWCESRNNSTNMKEQDVLRKMNSEGTFAQMGLKVRYLDTLYFSGFCQPSNDIRQVITVHANCCRTVNAKLTDLSVVLEAWASFNGTMTMQWSGHKACTKSWE